MTVLFPFALSEEKISCTNETQLAPWDACCNGVIYDRTDPIWMEKSCNVEPKTANLSFADSAWLAYDFAEQVCTFGSENSTHGNAELDDATYVDFEESSSGIQISEPCNEEMLPFSAYFAGNPNFNATYEPFEKCTEEFNRLLGISTFISFQSSAFTFCQAIAVQNLDKDLNINTQNLKNLESKMRGNIEKKIKRDLSKDGKLGKKREIVNIIMILKINDVFQDFAANVCKFDAPRKQNAGV
ncbi:unnamed protein product [Allacma fusca]|uniref:Uncharacterized protein n=1 Tax=Allacma fusca TaxID=39272 RepID=A0A8J2NST3_9HEXA|nr:unnamed protein product [Allacma fusca]